MNDQAAMGAYADALDRWRADSTEAASGPGGSPELAGNPVIAEVARALRVLGCEYRDQARAVLDMAPARLTVRERAAVRSTFPLDPADLDTRESAGTLPGDAERSRDVEDAEAERAAIESELVAEAAEARDLADAVERVDQAAEVEIGRVRYRWTEHRNDRGTWCRWSHVSVSANLAESADQRCPFECAASSIEVDPRPAEEVDQ